MNIDTRKRVVSLPERADMMMVDEARQALLKMHERSSRRVTIDFARTQEIDSSIVQLVASCARAFSDLRLTGLEGKPFGARLLRLTGVEE